MEFLIVYSIIISILCILLFIRIIVKKQHITAGYIEVDEITQMVKLHLSSIDLSDSKIKKIELDVKHDAKISRENQGL